MSLTFKIVLYGLVTILTITTGELTELVGLTTEENGIAWIEAFECTEGSPFTFNTPFNDMAGFIDYAQYAKSIKFVSADGSVNIYAQECNNQILALNRGYDMSCQIDTSTDLISGFSNAGSFVGNTNYMGNSCTSSCGYNNENFGEEPITLDKRLFDSGSCSTTRPGVHIKAESLICRVQDGAQKSINVFLGFDPQLSVDCSGNAIPYSAPQTRDCSVLAIDEFLLQCSAEFPASQGQISALDGRLNTLETNLQGQVNTNTASIQQLQTDLTNAGSTSAAEIQQLQTDIDDVNSRIDLFAAKVPQNMKFDMNNKGNYNGFSVSEGAILVLLMTNFITMVYIHCWRNNKGVVNKKHAYVVPIDEDSDVEQINNLKI